MREQKLAVSADISVSTFAEKLSQQLLKRHVMLSHSVS
jgi:hypothetical protein